ncbi:MAG TPA: hypothetical protein VFA75_08525 [Nevskia sp.]|nr:hypothetical protein [Nevskia sp.]
MGRERPLVWTRIMLNKLRQLLHFDTPAESSAPRRPSLRLPPGAIVAEQGLRHLPQAAGVRAVLAQMDEAYVVVRTAANAQWYATWQPYRGGWDLLCLEEDGPAAAVEPAAAPAPRLRCRS